MKIDAGDKSGECGDRFHACTVYCVVVNGGRDGLYPTTLKSRHLIYRTPFADTTLAVSN